MILDPAIHDVVDAAGWRIKFGIVSQDDFDALSARVAALESALDQAEAAIAAQAARLAQIEAANRIRYIFCPGDQRTYRVWMDLVDGQPDLNWDVSPLQMQLVDGATMLADVPADAVLGAFDRLYGPDAIAYDLSTISLDGALTLDWTPAT